MRTTRITTLLCVLGACFALGACGEDDETAPDSGGLATVTIEEESPGSGAGNGTPEPGAMEGEATPKPEKTVEGLPSSTPEPGPPLRFGAVISGEGIEVDTETVESGPSLEVLLKNESGKFVSFNLFANDVVVAAGQIEAGEQVVAQVRNLDPGRLVFQSGKLETTIKVVDEE